MDISEEKKTKNEKREHESWNLSLELLFPGVEDREKKRKTFQKNIKIKFFK